MKEAKRILYIENDKALVKSFREVVKDNAKDVEHERIELTVTYHMEQAKKTIEKERSFDGYIIDLMLPRNQEDLDELEKIEEERMGLLNDLIKATNFDSQNLSNRIIDLRRQIDDVDEEVSRLVDEKGGLELVKLIAKRHCGKELPDALDVPVIFWTARVAPEVKDESKEYVEGKYFRWMEKPTDEEEVFGELVKLIALDGGA